MDEPNYFLKFTSSEILYRSSLFFVLKIISPRNPAKKNCVPMIIVVSEI